MIITVVTTICIIHVEHEDAGDSRKNVYDPRYTMRWWIAEPASYWDGLQSQ
jgi:hypothetical protein